MLQCVIIGQGGLKVSIPVYLGRPYFLREGWERKVGYTSHTVTNPIWLPFFSLHGLHCLRFVQIITSVRSSSLTLSFPPCPMRCQLLPCPCPPGHHPRRPPSAVGPTRAPLAVAPCDSSAGHRARLHWPMRELRRPDAAAVPVNPTPRRKTRKKLNMKCWILAGLMLIFVCSNVEIHADKCWIVQKVLKVEPSISECVS